MEFRRSGQSNQRRRRVLKDDPSASAEDGAGEGTARRGRGNASLRPYSEHALAEHQPRVTDLIPQRPWTYTVILLGGLLVVVATQTLFLHHSLAERIVGQNNLSAFDPTRSGSIAGWFSSMLLGLSAVFAALVFTLRRHKLDDYRGRYRIWLPTAGLLLAASLDASTGLHRAGRGALEIVAARYGQGASIGSYPHFWWVSICLFGATVVGIRLGVEMRRSRAAVTKLMLAFGCYVALACVEWKLLLPGMAELTIVAASAARLLGDLCLCLATATYARYVYLDAQGIIAAQRLAREKRRREAREAKLARKAEKAARKAAAAEAAAAAKAAKLSEAAAQASAAKDEEADSRGKADAAPRAEKAAAAPAKPTPAKPESNTDTRPAATPNTAKPGPLAGRGALSQPAASQDNDDEDEDDEDYEGDSNLSRAERRRLKKMQRRDVRKAA